MRGKSSGNVGGSRPQPKRTNKENTMLRENRVANISNVRD